MVVEQMFKKNGNVNTAVALPCLGHFKSADSRISKERGGVHTRHQVCFSLHQAGKRDCSMKTANHHRSSAESKNIRPAKMANRG